MWISLEYLKIKALYNKCFFYGGNYESNNNNNYYMYNNNNFKIDWR